MLIKNKLFVVFGAAVLLTAAGYSVFSANKKKDLGHDIDGTLVNPGVFTIHTESIKRGMLRIQLKLKLKSLVPVEQLDFSMDDNELNGADPRYKVFSPEGGNIFPINHLKDNDYWGKFVKGDHLIFTLGNRVRGVGSDLPELIVVFPEVTDVMCRLLNKKTYAAAEIPSGMLQIR